jgi:methionine sulfoxide reductase heme-binding subunit
MLRMRFAPWSAHGRSGATGAGVFPANQGRDGTHLFFWLIAYRLLAWWQGTSEWSTRSLLALAVAVAIITFLGEAIGIAIAFHVSPLLVLTMIFDFGAGIRPGWQVLAAGLAVVVVDAFVARWKDGAVQARAVAAE